MAVHSEYLESVGVGNYIGNEIPSGDINSLNTTFTLVDTPLPGTEQVILNGLVQTPGSGLDYIITDNIIEFIKAPRTNSELRVNYFK